MGDGKKTCLGAALAGAAFILGVIAFFVGRAQLDNRAGWILGVSVFLFLGSIAGYTFYTVKSWVWVPFVVSVGYAVVPDLILGPADDIAAVALGVLVTGLLNWRKVKKTKEIDA